MIPVSHSWKFWPLMIDALYAKFFYEAPLLLLRRAALGRGYVKQYMHRQTLQVREQMACHIHAAMLVPFVITTLRALAKT